jgi:DMSO reductase anchor subunit
VDILTINSLSGSIFVIILAIINLIVVLIKSHKHNFVWTKILVIIDVCWMAVIFSIFAILFKGNSIFWWLLLILYLNSTGLFNILEKIEEERESESDNNV